MPDQPPHATYLVRHGRTHLNAEGRLRGDQNPPLDNVGRDEASALGRHFDTITIAYVVSSPLQRAHQTATAIAQSHGLPVHTADGLRDRDYGPWAGALIADIVTRFGTVDQAPGIEPWATFGDRVTRALLAELASSPEGPAVVVAHDAVNRALLHMLAGLDPDATQDTGCWNELRLLEGQWSAMTVNRRP